jgi:hypothetical protein
MAKKRERKKKRKHKRSFQMMENIRTIESAAAIISETRFQRNTLTLQLAGNPNFVGALHYMMLGIFVCSVFIGLLISVQGLGRSFEQILYKIASFVPISFPPDIYIPGVLTPPIMLLLIAGFTIFGYIKGATPFEIKIDKDTRSLKEKLFEFVFFFALAMGIIYLALRSDSPELAFGEIVSHPVFIGLFVIIFLGVLYYVFSRHQNTQLLIFMMESVLGVGFVLFLSGLVLYTMVKIFLYALNH